MRLRTVIFCTFVAGLVASPSPAPPPVAKGAPSGDRPAVTFQVASVNHLLDDIRAGIKFTSGPLVDRFLGEFNEEWNKFWGKEGLDGIDATQPAGGYVTFTDRPEQTAVVFVVPAPDEKKLLAMLGRTPIPPKPVQGFPGLYQIEIDTGQPIPMRLRHHDGHAYLGINVPDAGMEPRALVTASKVLDPAEKASLTARALPGKVPAGLWGVVKEFVNHNLDRDLKRAEQQNLKWAADLVTHFRNINLKGLGHLEQNTDAVTWRLNFDRKTATFTGDAAISPKAGTPFAEEIAKWGTTTNRFAGLADDKAAAWGVSKVPVFNAEVRGMLTAFLDAAEAEYQKVIPELGHALTKEAIALGKRTVAKGEGDVGLALHGPDKDGRFTLSAAVVADDPSGVEKELKALAKNLPLKDLFAFDVAKVGDVNLHEAKVGPQLPADIRRVFGPDAVVCLGVGKTAVYVAIGPEARAKVTAAAGLKPGPSAAFDARYNPVKVTAFAKAIEEQVAGHFANGLGPDDKLVPFWTVTVAGGAELTIKQTSNVLTPYRVMFFVMENFLR